MKGLGFGGGVENRLVSLLATRFAYWCVIMCSSYVKQGVAVFRLSSAYKMYFIIGLRPLVSALLVVSAEAIIASLSYVLTCT